MSEKSHVGMEWKVCPVTGKEWETNSILLDTQMKKTLSKKTITGFQPCPEVQEKLDEGYIALVEIDEKRSEQPFTPSSVFRLGGIAYIKEKVFKEIFVNSEVHKSKIGFTSTEVMKFLETLKT